MQRLAERLWSTDPVQSLRHAHAMLQKARNLGRTRDEIIALGLISKGYRVLGQPDSALISVNQALRLTQGNQDPELEAALKVDKARIYREIGEYGPALALLFQATAAFRHGEDPAQMAQINLSVAMVLHEQSQLVDALDYLQQAQMLLDESSHPNLMARIHNSRGVIYMNIDQLDVAQDDFVAALQRFTQDRDSVGLAHTHLHMGRLYGKRGRYDQAFLFVEQALNIQRSLLLRGDIAKSYLVKSNLFEDIGKTDSAARTYLRALEIASQTGDRSTHLGVLQGLAKVYLRQRKPDLAIYYGQEALKLASVLGASADRMEAHHTLYLTYERTGKVWNAYQHLKQYTDLRAQYLGYTEIQKVEAQKFTYDLMKKNSELERMELNQALNEEQLKAKDAEVRRQRSTIGLAVFGLLLTLAILLVLYLFYRSKRKSNTILRKLNNEIIKQKLAIEEINESLDQKVKARTLELEQRNQQLIEYGLYNAHQIRGPLANILGLIGLMKKHGVDTETYPILQKNLEESAHKLDQMVREMNDILEGNRKPKKKPEPSESHV